MADLFEQFGVEAKPVDLFEQFGVAPPTTSERNASAVAGLSVGAARDTASTTVLTAESDTPLEDYAQTEKLASQLFSPAEIAEFKANPITWATAWKYLEPGQVTPAVGGGMLAETASELVTIARKVERGEPITDAEQEQVTNYTKNKVEMSMRGMTIGGKIVYGAAQVPAFAADMYLIARGGKAAGAKVLAARTAGKVATKVATVAATDAALALAARTVASAAIAIPTRVLPAYAERRLSPEIAVTDMGEAVLKEAEESPAKSAMMAFGYTTAEIASEYSGGLIGKVIVNPVTKVALRPVSAAASKLPVAVQTGLYEAYKKIKPNAKLSEMLTTAGWHGMLNELGEERVADVLKATVGIAGGDLQTFDDYLGAITPDKEQLLVEAGIISLVGGVKSSADLAFNILQEGGMPQGEAKDTVDNMSAKEQEDFVSKHLHTKLDTPKKQVPIDNEQSTADAFIQHTVNQVAPLENLPKRAKAMGYNVEKGSDTQLLLSAFSRNTGQAIEMLKHGVFTTDEKGNISQVGKGLQDTLHDFDTYFENVEPSAVQRRQDLTDYLVSRRYTEDLAQLEDVEITDAQKEKAIQDMIRLQQKYGDKLAMVETIAQEIYQFQRDTLGLLVESGVLDKARFDEITAKHKNYIPFQRELPDTFNEHSLYSGVSSERGKVKAGSAAKVVKKIAGSALEIKDPLGSIIKNTINTVDLAAYNKIKTSIADLALVFPAEIQKIPTPVMPKGTERTVDEAGDVVSEKTLFGRDPRAPKGAIGLYRNGKLEYYKVSKPILQAIESMRPEHLNAIKKFFTGSARLLSMGTTTLPRFLLWTIPREAHLSFIQSGKMRFWPTDTAIGLLNILGNTSLYSRYKAAGGAGNSYIELDDPSIEKTVQKMLYDKTYWSDYVNPIKWLEATAHVVDQAPRVGAYRKAIQNGYSDLEASFIGQNISVDFARRGLTAKHVTRYLPFVNAAIQGNARMIRAMKENPVLFTMRAIATVSVPSMVLAAYYLHYAPDDERKEYLEFYDRKTKWYVKVNGQWQAIPKPFAVGYVFGTLVEEAMIAAFNEDVVRAKTSWVDIAQTLAGGVSPITSIDDVMPPLFKAAVEDVTNYNFFTGRNIVPAWLEGKVEPYLEKQPYTTKTAEELGKLFNYSPAKIDNWIRGQFGTAGTQTLQFSDWALRKAKRANGEDVAEPPVRARDHIFFGNFFVDDPLGTGSSSLIKFHENSAEIDVIKNSQRRLKGAERDAYVKEHARQLDAYPVLKQADKEIKLLNDQIEAVYEDTKMDAEQKAAKLREIRFKQTRVAREANLRYRKATDGEPAK